MEIHNIKNGKEGEERVIAKKIFMKCGTLGVDTMDHRRATFSKKVVFLRCPDDLVPC